jgi:hypothetical protein
MVAIPLACLAVGLGFARPCQAVQPSLAQPDEPVRQDGASDPAGLP